MTRAERIVIDARGLGGRSGPRGIGTYVRELLAGVRAIDPLRRVDVVAARHQTAPPGFDVAFRLPELRELVRHAVEPALVGVALRSRRYCVYHATEWGQAVASRTPSVVTVHDLIPFLFPGLYRRTRLAQTPAVRLLRHAAAIITPSASTARDVERIARVDPSRITVIKHGVDASFRPVEPDRAAEVRRRLRLPDGPLVLTVGVMDARKRLAALLDVMAAVGREQPAHLVIAGDQGTLDSWVREQVARAGQTRSTTFTGYVTDEDLVALHSAARCAVSTSAYEGFGLTILEAMACGTPVAAFDNSSIGEVAGQAGLLAPDGVSDALARIVLRMLADTPERAAAVATGIERASSFRWEETARRTLEVYDAVAGTAPT
jgi:glycosyltransferase involved in cell wall biosynthesis